MANVQPGDSVVIYGSGPVGLMAAYSAILRSARQVLVVDRHPDRLALAEKIGATPVDDSKAPPVDQVMELTNGQGADCGWAAKGIDRALAESGTTTLLVAAAVSSAWHEPVYADLGQEVAELRLRADGPDGATLVDHRLRKQARR